MTLIIVILLLVLLLGGGGYYGYGRYGYNGIYGVVGLVLVILLVLFLTGTLNNLRAQQRDPVPVLRKSTTLVSVEIPANPPKTKAKWNEKSYEGATSCVQEDNRITCNNGYSRTVR